MCEESRPARLPSQLPSFWKLFLTVSLERVDFPGLGKSSITETHSTQGTLESDSLSDTNLAPLPTREQAPNPAAPVTRRNLLSC